MRDDKDIHPITAEMLQIAHHPSNPWLLEYCRKHNQIKDKNQAVIMPEPKETVFGAAEAQDALIKHLDKKDIKNEP